MPAEEMAALPETRWDTRAHSLPSFQQRCPGGDTGLASLACTGPCRPFVTCQGLVSAVLRSVFPEVRKGNEFPESDSPARKGRQDRGQAVCLRRLGDT